MPAQGYTSGNMATISVRKYAISLDPSEIVDFTHDLEHFSSVFAELGFEPTGTYTFRYKDPECMMKTELSRSKDGYYLYAYVQAMDEHEYRLQEIAEAFDAHVVEGSKKPV